MAENSENKIESDEQLMLLIQVHDKYAFSVLVTRHSKKFYNLAYRSLINKADAEDVVQEAFLKIWRKPNLWSSKKQTKFTTWFYRVVLNACLDMNKKKTVTGDAFEQEFEESSKVEVRDESSQLVDLETALRHLPERQRTALNLCFYEGLSNQEAADIMGVRLKALQSLIMRAKTNLKKKLFIVEGAEYE
jgi:RNA polymerase sigma-70 factor (ECF subfamily)